MLAKLFTFLLFFVIIGCGSIFKGKPTSPVNRADIELLKAKSDLYSNHLPAHSDANGFIMTEKCDSLLFSGILAAARPDLNIDIHAAQSADGAWHRRPAQDCGPQFDTSRSTISRDMIIGLMWYMWENKDLETAVQLMDQVKSNLYWLKGEGTIGELLMTPSLLNTLAQMIQSMGGPNYTAELLFPVVFGKDTGFIAHLTAWHIHLRGEIFGSIPEDDLSVLKFHKERQPLNPLFQSLYHKYTDGVQSEALHLLLNASEWPNNKLPTTANHCDEWPINRDHKEKDWGPCLPEKEHTGAELIAIYELILK